MDDLRSGGPEARDRIDFRQLLSLGEGGDPVTARVHAEQFAGVARMTPFMLACALLYMSGLGTILWQAGQLDWVWWWTAAQLATQGLNLFVVWRVQRRGCQVSRICMRAAAVAAGMQALLFNGAIVAAAPELDPSSRAFAVVAHMALAGAGAFCFASAPLAGLVHVGIYAGGLMILNTTSPYPVLSVNLLGLTFFAVLARGIVLHAFTVARQVRARAALQDRGEVIAMLLNEYERHASDWLWESDADHRLVRASQRLSDVLCQPLSAVVGTPIGRFGAPGEPGFAAVARAMQAHRPFRSIQVRVETPEGDKWLSLSGTPRFAPDGSFLGYRGVGSDITEARRNQEQITRMATSDVLTGLANRATLRGAIQAALDEARTSRRNCALLLIDLDRFKAVNDTLGHPVGDELLREVSRRLREEVAERGVPARLGGDEFAVIVPPCGAAAAVAMAERIIAALSAAYQVRGNQISVGASVGIAFGPADAATVDDLMRAADLALYRAKGDGRGVARIYAPQLRADAEERNLLESGLRSALRDGDFYLVFQPIIELESGEVRAFEALLRWTHPTLGSVPPLKFLPVAEDVGLIDPIGAWVINEACRWAARWPEGVSVAVNLSPRQLANPALPTIVLRALANNGVAPDRLELELTEDVFMNETPATRVALAQLRAIGVRIGLDDFGTGYSSLSYLRHAMFNTIKIDRSFTRDAVDADGHSAEIVRHIVSLAASLGMETVAEGAETSEELEAVRRLGCQRVQGFHTGRPMAPEEATALVMPVLRHQREACAA